MQYRELIHQSRSPQSHHSNFSFSMYLCDQLRNEQISINPLHTNQYLFRAESSNYSRARSHTLSDEPPCVIGFGAVRQPSNLRFNFHGPTRTQSAYNSIWAVFGRLPISMTYWVFLASCFSSITSRIWVCSTAVNMLDCVNNHHVGGSIDAIVILFNIRKLLYLRRYL